MQSSSFELLYDINNAALRIVSRKIYINKFERDTTSSEVLSHGPMTYFRSVISVGVSVVASSGVPLASLRLGPFPPWHDLAAAPAAHLYVVHAPLADARPRPLRLRVRRLPVGSVVPLDGLAHQRVRERVLLHAFGLVLQAVVHEQARLVDYVVLARHLVEALLVVGVAVQLHIVAVPRRPADGRHHFDARGATLGHLALVLGVPNERLQLLRREASTLQPAAGVRVGSTIEREKT